jgi:hypothetical protein
MSDDRTVGNDSTGQPVIIGADDTALLGFTEQFEFRERYQHALDMIVVIDMADPQAAEKMQIIARDALDVERIRDWTAQGRPLPWLDERLGDSVAGAQKAVMEMFKSAV